MLLITTIAVLVGSFNEAASLSSSVTTKRFHSTSFQLQASLDASNNLLSITTSKSNLVSSLLSTSLLCLLFNPFVSKIQPVFASSSAIQKWNQVKYLDEEDNNRIKQASYSTDGKYINGIDINGNEFIVDITQSISDEQSTTGNGINLMFVPLAIIPIVAAAVFSSSSEGRAMKTISMTDGEKRAKIISAEDNKDIQSMDRTYEFNSFQQGINDGDINNVKTPTYLLSALLAGLFYLPPESLLKSQSDVGRKIRYNSYRSIQPVWKKVVSNSDGDGSDIDNNSADFGSVEYADISRLTYPSTFSSPDTLQKSSKTYEGVTTGVFRLYRFKLPDTAATSLLNNNLTTSIIKEASSNLGIAVSNAGGYHSTKDYFQNKDNNVAVNEISVLAYKAAAIAEAHDYQQSTTNTVDNNNSNSNDSNNTNNNYIRRFQSPQSNDEAWVNVNKQGHWNRLHTHDGAVWSGVYWIQSNRESVQRGYSGQLLLKPTSHRTERVELNTLELNRLGIIESSSNDKERSTIATAVATPVIEDRSTDCCDYIEIPPVEGTMILFPSWLHHAVIPLSTKPSYQKNNDGLRISLAFNVIEAD